MRKFASTIALCAAMATVTPALAGDPPRGPADQGPPPPAMGGMGPDCHMPPCPGMFGPHGFGPAGRGMFHHPGGFKRALQARLAERLNAMETYIGIRMGQIDAWRNFTDALLAMLQPPELPAKPPSDKAFAMSEAIANHFVEKGKKAQALLDAIDRLRSVLTPEQLERAKRAKPPIPPFLFGHHKPFGPRYMGRGPRPPAPPQP